MICVTTRFHLKHFWQIIPLYLFYKRMRYDLQTTPGLIRYAFLFQSPLVYYTFSIWESEKAVKAFSNVPLHIEAVRWAKRWCYHTWSAYWHLDAVSRYAYHWPGSAPWPAMTAHPTRPHQLVQAQAFVERSKHDINH